MFKHSFTCADPKSVKRLTDLTVFFTLLGSTHAKAVRNMLRKWTPVKIVDILVFSRKKDKTKKMVII